MGSEVVPTKERWGPQPICPPSRFSDFHHRKAFQDTSLGSIGRFIKQNQSSTHSERSAGAQGVRCIMVWIKGIYVLLVETCSICKSVVLGKKCRPNLQMKGKGLIYRHIVYF